jgi:hypothetical protein
VTRLFEASASLSAYCRSGSSLASSAPSRLLSGEPAAGRAVVQPERVDRQVERRLGGERALLRQCGADGEREDQGEDDPLHDFGSGAGG